MGPAAASARAFLITVLAVGALAALDLPRGVFAIPEAGTAEEAKFRQLSCGGAAVLISGDGLAVTLEEVVAADATKVEVVLPGGLHRTAEVVRRGAKTGAVLLRLATIDLKRSGLQPLPLADSAKLGVGDTLWTAGNSFGILEEDGMPALSRGIVSGLYVIPADSPPVRGRGGRVLSTYRGPVIETDAAINDGNQGGAALDDRGQLLGLVSLGLARERRLGTVVPINLVVGDLGLKEALAAPAPAEDPEAIALSHRAADIAASIALVYFERPNGLGNPQTSPRPPVISEETPLYERERLNEAWDRYYHEQQVMYTDQPISAVVIDAEAGLLLTSASNLHGDALRGRVLLEGPHSIDCEVVARHLPLDLALLRAAKPLPLMSAVLAAQPDLACGDQVALVGRHRLGSGFTVTTGVVSAVARRQMQSEHFLHQTDALANYGNLGGAVVDLGGAVVGMVTMLGPKDDWPWLINSGVALFVDSATINQVLPQLKQGISQEKSRTIGFGVQLERSGDVKDGKDNDELVIKDVVKDTGAAAAGVQPGDVLLRVDGIDVHSHAAVSRVLLRHRAGDKVEAVLRRDGKELTLAIELRVF